MTAARATQRRPLGYPTTRSARSEPAIPTWAVGSAALAPVALTLAWISADALQPSSYSPIHQTLSVLAGRAGADRWVMTAALFVVGACYLMTAAGLRGLRDFPRALLAVAGLSSVWVAVCPEPAHGSTAQHLAWTALGEVAIAVWPAFVTRRPTSRMPICRSQVWTATTALSITLLGWLVIETQHGGALGLAERVSLSVQISVPFAVTLLLRRACVSDTAGARSPARTSGAGHPGLG